MGKLTYEAIEEIDPVQVEAVAATGAGSAQILDYATIPQILPAFAGITVYRWDINIRESTVLGLVGAGGIGLQLQSSLNILAWNQVTVILLVILVTVIISEYQRQSPSRRYLKGHGARGATCSTPGSGRTTRGQMLLNEKARRAGSGPGAPHRCHRRIHCRQS